MGYRVIYDMLIAKLCPTPCLPTDCSLPGSSVHGILQARIPEGKQFILIVNDTYWRLSCPWGYIQQRYLTTYRFKPLPQDSTASSTGLRNIH